MVQFTASLVESFSGTYLSPLYDNPKPTPEFHREGWALYCSSVPQAAIAAPREHAKSTAFTHDFILAGVLFRVYQYVILISSTEEMAKDHLHDISKELHDNEDLVRDFGIKGFVSDQKTDITVEFRDGYQFRITAKGAGQKVRGLKWLGKRPGLILGDDLEDDELVANKETRKKFRRWFLRALRPALRDGGVIRVHGTILHEDSLLSGLMKGSTWKHLRYKAHNAFDDFTNILWPEKFPIYRLKEIRQDYIEKGDSAGYSQEYLNDPFDHEDAYLRVEDLLEMKEVDYDSPKRNGAAADFAISKADSANRTSISVGGKDVANLLHFIDQRVGRWDALEIIEEMFSVQLAYNPEVFWVEDGQIWKALSTMLYKEMQRRDIWINVEAITPIKDKAARGRSLQRRTRAHACRFDKRASWYPGFESEILRFTGTSEATLDDQFDSAALLSAGFDTLNEVTRDDFVTEEEAEFERASMFARAKAGSGGRSKVTGY